MEFRLLGPVEARTGGKAVPLGGPRPKALLARLLLDPNRVVAAERLADDLWHGEPPPGARTTLQAYVSRLRKSLGAATIETRGPGYAVVVRAGELDVDRFEDLVATAASARPERASALLAEALDLWRGPALADLAYEPFAQAEIARLEDLRLNALEERIQADLARGASTDLVGELEALVTQHPLRERLHAQRMLALYRAGRQAEALTAYRDARRVLVDELGIEPSAALKQLELQILAQDASLDAAPTAAPRLDLPAAATPLLGRSRETQECCALLRQPSTRLLTLTGAGGIGKTRLALAVAASLAGELRDGIVFVPLARIANPELVASTIAHRLGLGEADEPPEVTLKRHLGAREVLLVIDNFEQLVAAAPLLGELLETSPGLELLVTSRALLRLTGEHQFAVPALDLPDAVSLLVERARALNPAFVVTDENAQAVAEICARLDGLPLALELAAARLRLLAPAALLERLERRLPILTGGPRDAPPRQQTLRATLEWSFDLLSADEQTQFVQLACFVGGSTVQAAEEVCGATLDELASLVDKGLIRQRDARFDMLATIREYAHERLDALPGVDDLRRRHADYFTLLAERAEPEILRAEQAVWLETLEAERDNFRSALEWTLAHGEFELALRLIGALRRAWVARGYLSESRRWLELALEKGEGAAAAVRAKALYGLGRVALAQGDYDDARAQLADAAALYRELRESEGLVFALADLAWITSAQGDQSRAVAFAEEALAEARHGGGETAVAAALHSLACARLDAGDYEEARIAFTESLALRRARGDKRNVANSLSYLGATAFLEGDLPLARTLLDESLDLGCELGNSLVIAAALANLGLVALFDGANDRAHELASESLALARDVGDKWTMGECLNVLAGVAAARGDAPRAASLAGAAEALHDSIQAPASRAERAVADPFLSSARAALGDEAFAAEHAAGRAVPLDAVIDAALASAQRVSSA